MQAVYSGQHGLHNLAVSITLTSLSCLHLCASYLFLPLNSKFIFSACSVKMDSGPLNIFLLTAGTMLSVVSRGNGRGIARGKNSASWFWWTCLAHSCTVCSFSGTRLPSCLCVSRAELLQCTRLPQHAASAAWVLFLAPGPCRTHSSSCAQLLPWSVANSSPGTSRFRKFCSKVPLLRGPPPHEQLSLAP